MRSSFFEYRVATSALQTARAGLNVTSNNVANASNKGYSRQYIEQRASRPLTLFNGKGMYGTGSEVYGVGQFRSEYLDKKYWHENSVRGEYSLKLSQLNIVETTLNSMSSAGLTNLFDGFFMSLQDLTQNAGDDTYRTNSITTAQSLARQINSTAQALVKQQQDINAEVATMVQVINSIGNQIASLNKQIGMFELDGSRANDLRDQRIRLVDELSGYINVEVREIELNEEYALGMWPEPEDRGRSNKKFVVLINGEEFVSHDTTTGLRVAERTEKLNTYDAPKLYDIYFANSNKKLDLFSASMTGELKGLIDLRDGNNSTYTQFPLPKSPSTNKYVDNGDGTCTLTFAGDGMFDINGTGYIELTDPVTGGRSQYEYTSYKYEYDDDGNMTGISIRIKQPANYTGFQEMAKRASASIGRSTAYKGIPHYMNKLNTLVRNFAMAINEGLDAGGNPIPGASGHVGGYDAYGNQGNLFFTYDPFSPHGSIQTTGKISNYLLINAENFIVNPELLSDPKKLAASDNVNADESNNNIILQLLEMKDNRSLFREGKLSDFVLGIASELGIDTKQAKQFSNNYSEVVTYIDNQRESYSGVDLNEEMVYMMKYQQLYQAAAKLVNVIDGIYDTCINRLGVR